MLRHHPLITLILGDDDGRVQGLDSEVRVLAGLLVELVDEGIGNLDILLGEGLQRLRHRRHIEKADDVGLADAGTGRDVFLLGARAHHPGEDPRHFEGRRLLGMIVAELREQAVGVVGALVTHTERDQKLLRVVIEMNDSVGEAEGTTVTVLKPKRRIRTFVVDLDRGLDTLCRDLSAQHLDPRDELRAVQPTKVPVVLHLEERRVGEEVAALLLFHDGLETRLLLGLAHFHEGFGRLFRLDPHRVHLKVGHQVADEGNRGAGGRSGSGLGLHG